MTTTPDENRPNSTAYGFGSTDTDSIASSGSMILDNPVDGSTSVFVPTCMPAWLGLPPLMLTPFGASMTLASSLIVACKPPPPPENVSISLPLMVSVGASVFSFDTTGLAATTLTLCVIPSIGRSIVMSAERPAVSSAIAAVVTNEASVAVTLYRPGARPTTLKWPSSSERSVATFLSAASDTTTSAPGSLTVDWVVTVPWSTPVRGACCDGAWARANAGRSSRTMNPRNDCNLMDVNSRPKKCDDGADHRAECRAGQDVHCVVVSADYTSHANARRNSQQNGPCHRQGRHHTDGHSDGDRDVAARECVHAGRPVLHDVRSEAMDPARAERGRRLERPRRARLKHAERRERRQIRGQHHRPITVRAI